MKKRTITQRDYIKANRRASRLAEIENHGRPVSIAGVHKSKKVYDRKRDKAEMKKALPYLFLCGLCEWLQNLRYFINTPLSTPHRDHPPL
ncbi:MAG: hypothetical protein ACRCUJ_06750 [Phocaeicola sp.]